MLIISKQCDGKETTLLQILVCESARAICKCVVCGLGFHFALPFQKSGARGKQNKFPSSLNLLIFEDMSSFCLVANVWLDEAFGGFNELTYQNTTEPKLLFVFIFSFQSQIKDLAVVNYLTKPQSARERQMLYTSVLCAGVYLVE